MRNIRSEFAAERIDVELPIHSLVSQSRKVHRRGLQVEAVSQSQSGRASSDAFPVSCTARAKKFGAPM